MYVYTSAEKWQRAKLSRQTFRQALADCVDPQLNARMFVSTFLGSTARTESGPTA